MTSLFSKPKSPSMPKVPEPPALPETPTETEDFEARRLKKRKGFSKTILTGGLTPLNSDKKTVLG